MATNSNAQTDGVAVNVYFTEQGRACLPPKVLEALMTANWRVTFPSSNTVTGNSRVQVSTLPDNIARIDNEGKIYVPGISKKEVLEQTINLSTTTAPGVPVEISFDASGATDLNNVINNINFDIQPPEAPVYIGPPRISGTRLVYSVYRIDNGSSSPYPEVSVRGFGRLFVVPSPSPI